MNPTLPIQKQVVLVGAGNAHLVFTQRWAVRPVPGVAITLVSEAPVIPYSAMVPANITGDYGDDEVTIDLVRLCTTRGVRFLAERVTAIDPLARQVKFIDRPPLSFDVLSLGIGSLPAIPADCDFDRSWPMRPLGPMIRRFDELDAYLGEHRAPFRLAIVGGGASGCELSLAIQKRLARHSHVQLSLLHSHERLVPNYTPGVARRLLRVLDERGITVRLRTRVTACRGGMLHLDHGDPMPIEAVLWATGAAPSPLVRASGLPVDDHGFLRVESTLQSVGDALIFGTGDCVAFDDHPTLPRNGVHAVRQGKVLFDNIGSVLQDRRPRPFQPQRVTLALLNTADGEAIVSYGPVTLKNRWARRFKDRIDRRWMRMHRPMVMAATSDSEGLTMRCGGCGSKISGDVLSAVLKRLDLPDDPRVIMGTQAGEDAAVHRTRPELFGDDPANLVEVQTVDYFRSFVDDPFLFGRIAAHHAVSDLYAMNARPFTALAIATLPFARGPIQDAQLFELLSGAVATFRELGIVLTGGHTTEGQELALGFVITGHGEEGRLFRKGALQAGDALILTKPLGTGALLAAWMRGACRAEWFTAACQSMLRSNREAAGVFRDHGVTACTDITGFGLAGHVLEMLDASQVSARIDASAVPRLPGFDDVVAQGIVSTLQRDNAKLACRIAGEPHAWLFDPQTSGGLLAGVAPSAVPRVLADLRARGVEPHVIGHAHRFGKDAGPRILVDRPE